MYLAENCNLLIGFLLIVNWLCVFVSGSIRCVTGEGMPRHRNPFEKGNLYVKFEIAFPPNQFIGPDKLKASNRQLILFACLFYSGDDKLINYFYQLLQNSFNTIYCSSLGCRKIAMDWHSSSILNFFSYFK